MRVFHKSLNVAGTGPALRKKTARVPVGRGPVPRHRPCNPTFAGDRPTHYGVSGSSRNVRGGQAPALRGREAVVRARQSPHYGNISPCLTDYPPVYGGDILQGIIPFKIWRSCPTEECPTFYRRAWALGCHTRRRAGFPRHAAIAGDRPPRYGVSGSSRSDRGGQAPLLRCERQFSQRSRRKPARMRVWHPRAPRYGKKRPGFP